MIIIKHKVLLDGFVEVFGQATGDRRFIPLQTRDWSEHHDYR